MLVIKYLALVAFAIASSSNDVDDLLNFEGDEDYLNEESTLSTAMSDEYKDRMINFIDKYLDANQDGNISADEVSNLTKTVLAITREAKNRGSFKSMDVEPQDERIQLSEWLKVAEQYEGVLVPKDEVERDGLNKLRFEVADMNNDGVISPGNEFHVLLNGNPETKESEMRLFAAGILKSYDLNKDGNVTFEEFMESAAAAASGDESSDDDITEWSPEQQEYLKQDFESVDLNKDGLLNVTELYYLVEEEMLDLMDEDDEEQVKAFTDDVMSLLREAADDSSDSVPKVFGHEVWKPLAGSMLTGGGEILLNPEGPFSDLKSVPTKDKVHDEL